MKKYRLKDEKYRKSAQAIADFTEGGSLPLEYYISKKGSRMRARLEEYGVFDLWFEEVPTYKAGDYIYIINTSRVYKIADCVVEGDTLYWNIVGEKSEVVPYDYSTHLSIVRHATAEEIEEYNRLKLPSINGYRGKRIFDYIVYGCKSMHIQDFIRLYETCIDLEVSSITIEGQEIKIETMQEIYEKIH